VADIVDSAVRSRMMRAIGSKNTKQEVSLRKLLHRKGFRYRLHSRNVPGKPDIVFPAHRAVVFVHGCFWHGHDCSLFRLPGTRPEFWSAKIARNGQRDSEVLGQLDSLGWRHLVVWECAIRGQGKSALETTADRVAAWLLSRRRRLEIRGPR
jgi:DNA mismatch endonuclease (patch repair protein)